MIRRLTSLAVVGVCLGGFAAFGTTVAWIDRISDELPDHMEIARWTPEEGTVFRAADDTTIGRHAAARRTFAPIGTVPPLVIGAFLAAEDARYFDHVGIDYAALVRSAIVNVGSLGSGSRPIGGSTITQQVVKNVLLDNSRTYDRKVREAVLALRAERDVGKRRILEVYLNQIYLGAGAYGVAEAASTYFGKSLNELTVPEAALLAALPKAPSALDPFRNPSGARVRRDYVIDRMEATRVVTPEAAEKARASAITLAADTSSADPAMAYPLEEARRRVVALYGGDAVYGTGGTVRTTIVPAVQRAAHRTLREGLADADMRNGWRGPIGRLVAPYDTEHELMTLPPGAEDWQTAVVVGSGRAILRSGSEVPFDRRGNAPETGDVVLLDERGGVHLLVQVPELQGAIVAMDPSNGAVLAMAGGFSAELSEFNRATQARRQTGSVFKPFVYLAGMEIGMDATSPLLDVPIALSQSPGLPVWRPSNAGGRHTGLMTLRRALETSSNLAAVRLAHDIGIGRVANLAERVGLPLPSDAGPAAALGSYEASPLDVAAAYSAIAAGGPAVGARLLETDERAVPGAVDPIAAAQVSSVLRGTTTHGTARSAFADYPWPLATKTGTTNESRDVWLVAYNPGIVTVAWIGYDDRRSLGSGSFGGNVAGPIARAFLDAIEGDVSHRDFPLPDGASEILVNEKTGRPDADGGVIEIVRDPIL